MFPNCQDEANMILLKGLCEGKRGLSMKFNYLLCFCSSDYRHLEEATQNKINPRPGKVRLL